MPNFPHHIHRLSTALNFDSEQGLCPTQREPQGLVKTNPARPFYPQIPLAYYYDYKRYYQQGK